MTLKRPSEIANFEATVLPRSTKPQLHDGSFKSPQNPLSDAQRVYKLQSIQLGAA